MTQRLRMVSKCERRLVAALSLLALVACSDDPALENPPRVPAAQTQLTEIPTPAATELRLSEIRVLPADGAAAFVEIINSGSDTASLDGTTLRNEEGDALELAGGLTLAPGGLLVVSFDGREGGETGVVHAAAADFTGGESGGVWLHTPDGLADAIVWGKPNLASVDLCRGGRCGSPAAGSVLARLPGERQALSPAAWAPLDPELATPGAPNPRPPVTAFAAIPGVIFSGEPRFSWYSVPGGARYRLQVARDETFGSLAHETDVEAAPGVRLEQLTALGPELPSGDYFWRVQALSAAGEPAEFSRPMPFSVDPSRRLASTLRNSAQQTGGEQPTAETPGNAFTAPPARVPEGLLKVLDVPTLKHAKDTRMLALEAPSEDPLRSWDTPDFAGYPYCARAGVAMLNAYYGGKLSQDRIGYEAFKNLRRGPEYDLPVVGVSDDRTSDYTLPLAIGTRGDYVRNPHVRSGSDGSACYDYAKEQALAYCARQGWAERSEECTQYRLAHEHEIPCPPELAFSWGFRAIEDIQREINAGRPIIATNPAHLFLIVGYRLEDGEFFLFYHDAGGTEEIRADAGGLTRYLESYWTGLAPITVGSDEPEVGSDSDGDGVVDFDETLRFGTDPANADSDDDGVRDKDEIRASVWDPEHGYHKAVSPLSIVASDPEVERAAANADLSGRDFDGDGLAMELDFDSDGGGCDDGREDENRDGRRSGAETSNFIPDDDAGGEQGNCVESCRLDEETLRFGTWTGTTATQSNEKGFDLMIGGKVWYENESAEEASVRFRSRLRQCGDEMLTFGPGSGTFQRAESAKRLVRGIQITPGSAERVTSTDTPETTSESTNGDVQVTGSVDLEAGTALVSLSGEAENDGQGFGFFAEARGASCELLAIEGSEVAESGDPAAEFWSRRSVRWSFRYEGPAQAPHARMCPLCFEAGRTDQAVNVYLSRAMTVLEPSLTTLLSAQRYEEATRVSDGIEAIAEATASFSIDSELELWTLCDRASDLWLLEDAEYDGTVAEITAKMQQAEAEKRRVANQVLQETNRAADAIQRIAPETAAALRQLAQTLAAAGWAAFGE